MEIQGQRKNHPSGHESQGVHLCPRCGWPFPNPHPSAKHRRAHKRICGTIEGYKLVGTDVDHNLNLNAPDESDDEHKTPTEDGGQTEVDKSGAAKRSSHVEEEVFTDAVANFPDGVSGMQTEAGLLQTDKSVSIVEKSSSGDSTGKVSAESAITGTEVIRQDLDPVDGKMKENIVAPEDTIEKLGSKTCTLDLFSVPVIHEPEKPTEESNGNESASDSSHILAAAPVDTSAEVRMTADCETSEKSSSEDILHMNEVKLNEEITVYESSSCKGGNVMPGGRGFQFKEESGDILFSEVSLSGLSPELSTEEASFHTNAPLEQVYREQQLDPDISGDFIDGSGKNSEEVENFHVLSIPKDLPVVEHAEKFMEDFRDHKAIKMLQTSDLGSGEKICKEEEVVCPASEDLSGSNFKEVSEICSDAHNPEISSAQQLDTHKPVDEDMPLRNDISSCEGSVPVGIQVLNELETTITQETNVVSEPGKMETNDNFSSTVEHFGNAMNSSPDVDGLVAPGDIEVLNDLETTITQETNVVSGPGKMETNDNFSSTVEHFGNAMNSSPDVDGLVAPRDTEVSGPIGITGEKGSPDYGVTTIETLYIVGDTERKHDMDKISVESQLVTESVQMSRNIQSKTVDNLNNEREVSCDQENSGKECLNFAGVDISEGHRVEDSTVRIIATEATVGSQEWKDTENNTFNGLGTKLAHLDEASNTPVKKDVKNDDAELPEACETKVSTSIAELPCESCAGMKQTISEEQDKKGGPLSSDAVNFIENPNAGKNAGAGDITFPRLGSSLQDESDNKHVDQQLTGSALDASVDSNSRADSLECNWGSVSVLSTQSDPPVLVEPDVLPPKDPQSVTETGKSNEKLKKDELDGKKLWSPEVFEPPSFMTLVEMAGDRNAPISAQKETRAESASAQAGWFPSMSHASNNSQGRTDESIAAAESWSDVQHHSPLKSLLVEANRESKLKSGNPKESSIPEVQKEDNPAKDNKIGSVNTVSSILASSEAPDLGLEKETSQEWNSPARYPVDIKREKRKVKGRPYWAQFVCCSSVH